MSRAVDQRWMALALSLGARGLGQVWPNPAVGCVIVKDGRIVGRGWTQPGGRPHAEAVALVKAGAAARGATAYVTLEPCAHTGQTPPCAQALITAGLARVVVATGDPDPRVAGRGLEDLRKAGIQVDVGVLQAGARRANAGFFSRIEQVRPVITLKLAVSLDGRIATASGQSQWITGPQARRKVHTMRARHDAVMVGAGTMRADDPSLTVRGLGMAHNPVRVVISTGLELPQDGVLAGTARDVPVWLVHGAQASDDARNFWTNAGAHLIRVGNATDSAVDLRAAMQALAGAGLTRVFCEGGGALAAGLLRADLVDELVMFSAGIALGADGRPGVGALQTDALADAPQFDLQDVSRVGSDVLHHWVRRHGLK